MDPEKAKIKPPTTYKEQVEILKNRNLLIENPINAEKTLQRINYYRLTAYGLTLKDTFHTDEYINGATFSKILSLYEFDRRLRLLLMGALETIEIAMRTNISYEMAHKFGSLGYKDKENFINEKYHHDFLNEPENLIIRSRKGELFY